MIKIMLNLREIYKWLNDFNCKTLTSPPHRARYIEIRPVDENGEAGDQEHAQFLTMLPFGRSECFGASIIGVQQLIKNDDDPEIKNVFELTLQIKTKVDYSPGDTLGVLSKNSEESVNAILAYGPTLKPQFSQKIRITHTDRSTNKNSKIPGHLPSKCTTLGQIFSECVDLHAIPKKAFLWALHEQNCLADATERRFIEILASREGSQLYSVEILQKQCTFLSLLEVLRSWQFTIHNIGVLLEHLPRLMPRPYSISNSLLVTEGMKEFKREWTILKIIFSVKKPPGITTAMLQRLITEYKYDKISDTTSRKSIVNLYLRESNRFQLIEDDLARPLIMIAIGTGLAPFIGFLEHIRERRKQRAETPKPVTWLLFGCKRKTKQLCANRIHSFIADGTLSRISECYSRDSSHLGMKYVQEAVDENFINLLLRGDGTNNITRLFICGSRKMTLDIRSSILKTLVDSGECNAQEDANRILDELLKNGQYNEDVWI